MDEKATNDKLPQYVSYTVGGDEYGVEISQVKEIKRVATVTSIPQSPPFILGVINLRGRIVPVMDMRARMGYGKSDLTRNSRIIVCDIKGEAIGLLVDTVYHVLSIPQSHLIPPPEMFNTISTRFVKSVARIGERLILLIDLEKLIDLKEIDEISNPVACEGAPMEDGNEP